ncbi:conserved hypothetical protein [Ricinus communis]|uniref:Uncharacterized protein n=1 Tax=Ricinus communis TaxID=3988 RepID=B9T6N9_RICCO|nr:conserved hypothetical protein [Ricinus communis]|eukprot:XP_025015673.1 uncharacterized protein LOC112536958 [Ricinus communis]
MKKPLEESQENEDNNDDKDLAVWDLGSPLYDSYEVVSLSHLIERHLMTLPSLGSRKLSKKIFPPPFSDNVVPATLPASSAEKDTLDRPSLAKTLREFIRVKLWRKRKNGVGDTKDDEKSKKLKAGVLRGFSNRFGL